MVIAMIEMQNLCNGQTREFLVTKPFRKSVFFDIDIILIPLNHLSNTANTKRV